LFHHSSRVYYWGALAGKHRGLKFDRELLYAGAMFHDMGLTPAHSSAHERFEVDGANVARDFLRSHGVDQHDIDTVWTAIALHTTPGIPQHMHPVVALVTAGVEMDVLGLTYAEYSDGEREAVVHAHPRTEQFKEDIILAFYDGIKHKPDTTFGNVKADVLEDKAKSWTVGDRDRIRCRADQFRRRDFYALAFARAPAIVDPQVAAVDPAEPLQRSDKCRDAGLTLAVGLREVNQHADAPHALVLLCAHRERPRCGHTADQRDELAPSHVLLSRTGSYPTTSLKKEPCSASQQT
jgi:hypothetical protein